MINDTIYTLVHNKIYSLYPDLPKSLFDKISIIIQNEVYDIYIKNYFSNIEPDNVKFTSVVVDDMFNSKNMKLFFDKQIRIYKIKNIFNES